MMCLVLLAATVAVEDLPASHVAEESLEFVSAAAAPIAAAEESLELVSPAAAPIAIVTSQALEPTLAESAPPVRRTRSRASRRVCCAFGGDELGASECDSCSSSMGDVHTGNCLTRMLETATEKMDDPTENWIDALNKLKSFCMNWSRLKDVVAPSSNEKCYQLAGGTFGGDDDSNDSGNGCKTRARCCGNCEGPHATASTRGNCCIPYVCCWPDS